MADLPAPIFRPLAGRRSVWYNQQPLRSGLSGTLPPTQAGFTDDATTVAVYQFEGPLNLLEDAIGGNTLTNNNSVGTDASDTQEASFSASFNGSNWLSIADGSQDTGFPLKNGETNKEFTITQWFKLTNVTGPKVLWGKGDAVNRSVQFAVLANGNLGYRVHTGVVFEDIDLGASLTANVWYHYGFEANHNTNAHRLVLWNDSTASETIVTASGTVAVPTPAAPFTIGASGDGANYVTGLFDEFSINGRILGIPDIRQIRQGVYDGPLSNRLTSFGVQSFVISTEKFLRLSQFGLQVFVQAPAGLARASSFGVQILHLGVPSFSKTFPVLPAGRVFESQTGKRVFPLP